MQSTKYPSSTVSASVASTLGAPHIARPVADQQIVDALAVGDLDALVVHLDLLVGLEVVPDEHLVAAANQRRADLHWRQPVDVDVRRDVAWKIHGDERHVGQVVEVIPSRGDDRFRLLADDVIHDREIVRRQIPHDAHVVLKESQVDPRGIEVIQRSKGPVVDQLANLPNRAAEQERVVDHDPQVLLARQLDELDRLRRRRRERLLHEDVLAVFERRFRQVEVRPDRRDDRHGIDVAAIPAPR